MSTYNESNLDKDNRKWFNNNNQCNTLQKIAVGQSSIRGLENFEIRFSYPITVIVGENGSGKSTVLALASCAFHNNTSFCPMSLLSNTKKQRCYYTYSDFFAFTSEERGILADVKITSTFLSDKKTSDTRSKTPKGKWKDYDTRPKRAVSFLGINRILPPSESQTYRHYSGYFGENLLSKEKGQELAGYMNRIFGRDYTEITQVKHRKYRLYGCIRKTGSYTGFNMGAGENAVLQLLFEIMNSGKGALIVVDEIELGLHVQAQKQLMEILKELCKKNNTQIICSSHSATILSSVPHDGRIMLKSKNGNVVVDYNIPVEVAVSELSGEVKAEKAIFVEDEIAKMFIETILPNNIRRRVQVMVQGSADSSMRYAMATHLREEKKDFLAVMDGDKRQKKNEIIKYIVGSLNDCKSISSDSIKCLLDNSISFLPGNEWPERSIINSLLQSDDISKIMDDYSVQTNAEMKEYLQKALDAGKHNEFYTLAGLLNMDQTCVIFSAIRQYRIIHNHEIKDLISFISSSLS